jgi:hypothetical protein
MCKEYRHVLNIPLTNQFKIIETSFSKNGISPNSFNEKVHVPLFFNREKSITKNADFTRKLNLNCLEQILKRFMEIQLNNYFRIY